MISVKIVYMDGQTTTVDMDLNSLENFIHSINTSSKFEIGEATGLFVPQKNVRIITYQPVQQEEQSIEEDEDPEDT